MPNGTEEPLTPEQPDPGISELAEDISARLTSTETLSRVGRMLVNGFIEATDFLSVYATQYSAVFMLWMADRISAGEERNRPQYEKMIASGIEDLFGIQVDTSGIAAPGARDRRKQFAQKVGDSILTALSGGVNIETPQPITSTLDPARNYLNLMAQLAMEGWLFGTMSEIMTLGQIQNAGDLDDVMAQVMGLGRISRRVLGPIIDVKITTPAEWKVNELFEPRLLSSAQAARQKIRGRWTQEQFDVELARQGFGASRREAVLNEAQRFLAMEDMELAVRFKVWTREQALQHLQDQGYQSEIAETLLTVERARIRDRFQTQMGNAIVSAYVSRDIERGEFGRLLDSSVVDDESRARFFELGEMRRLLNLRRISEGRVKAMVLRGILAVPDYRRFLEREGYLPDDIILLELELRDRLRTRAEAEEAKARREAEREAERLAKEEADLKRQAELEAEQDVKRPSLATVRKGFVRGLITSAEFRAFLVDEGYQGTDLELLIGLADQEREIFVAQQEERTAREGEAQLRGLSLSQIERAVIEGVLSEKDYRSQLESLNFGSDAIDVLLSLLRDKVDQRTEAKEARRRGSSELAERGISLADFERAVKRGIRSLDDYRRFLATEGFTVDARALMVALLRDELADLSAAEAKRQEAGTRATSRRISLGDFELAVKRGARTIDEYQALLADLGFSTDDQALMATLLNLELEELSAAGERRAEADAAAEAGRRRREEEAAERARRAAAPKPPRELSLAQIQKAVTLGVVSLATFRSYLDRQNLRAEDREVLVQLLLVDLEKVQRDRERRNVLDVELQPSGLSLGRFERAVKKGVRSIGDYAIFVGEQGFGADDQQLLIALLEVELDQQKESDERRAELAASLLERGIDLNQVEQLVLEGSVSLDDYVAFLSEEGIEPEDVALLVQLLVLKQQTDDPLPEGRT